MDFCTIINAIRDYISVYDGNGRCVFSNKAALERSCGMDCRSCVSLIDKCLTLGETVESVFLCDNGCYCEVRAFPEFSDDGVIARIVIVGSDATLKIAVREEAMTACRSLAVSKLAGSMAHEINNPCGHLLLNLDLLKDIFEDAKPIFDAHLAEHGDFMLANLSYMELSPRTGETINEMLAGTRQIARIVQDLRRFSRNDPIDLEGEFNLNDSVFTAIRLTNRQVRQATDHLTLDFNSSLPLTHGDACQIERVLVNLILNACQALPSRDRGITISTRFIEAERVNVVSIADEGIGVDPALLPHLCDPFFTTNRAGAVGLGLSVAQDIVTEHNGSLEFRQTPGTGGLTVVLKLPVIDGGSR